MLEFTTEDDKEQDLVTWDQLSANARQASNEVRWGKQKMPLSDDEFKNNLELAWPTEQQKK
uniref:Uncharacterized protein n=1 Tax=Hyaloperonospora arabidopsidis (strain Emoy2) TaxID=559515 RepID=M4C190_HYAAE